MIASEHDSFSALALELTGKFDPAIESIARAQARCAQAGTPNPAYSYLLAKLLAEHVPTRHAEARTLLREAIALSPNPGGHFGYRGKDFTEAAKALLTKLGET
jgi:hypothetical protein